MTTCFLGFETILKNLSDGLFSVLCIILNVCSMSPLLLRCAIVDNFNLISLSLYVRSLSGGISLMACFWILSTLSISLRKWGYQIVFT